MHAIERDYTSPELQALWPADRAEKKSTGSLFGSYRAVDEIQ